MCTRPTSEYGVGLYETMDVTVAVIHMTGNAASRMGEPESSVREGLDTVNQGRVGQKTDKPPHRLRADAL